MTVGVKGGRDCDRGNSNSDMERESREGEWSTSMVRKVSLLCHVSFLQAVSSQWVEWEEMMEEPGGRRGMMDVQYRPAG